MADVGRRGRWIDWVTQWSLETSSFRIRKVSSSASLVMNSQRFRQFYGYSKLSDKNSLMDFSRRVVVIMIMKTYFPHPTQQGIRPGCATVWSLKATGWTSKGDRRCVEHAHFLFHLIAVGFRIMTMDDRLSGPEVEEWWTHGWTPVNLKQKDIINQFQLIPTFLRIKSYTVWCFPFKFLYLPR